MPLLASEITGTSAPNHYAPLQFTEYIPRPIPGAKPSCNSPDPMDVRTSPAFDTFVQQAKQPGVCDRSEAVVCERAQEVAVAWHSRLLVEEGREVIKQDQVTSDLCVYIKGTDKKALYQT
eukprot:scaffold21287_cov22-Tisochrysis_lutea.AAC.2